MLQYINKSEFDEQKTSILFTNTTSFTNNDFVACIYENQWWLGIVKDKSDQDKDLLVHFFHPAGPKTAFQLSKKDIVWVPVSKVVRRITPTELTLCSGGPTTLSINFATKSQLSNILIKL